MSSLRLSAGGDQVEGWDFFTALIHTEGRHTTVTTLSQAGAMRRVKGPLTLSVTACADISVAPHAAVGASSSKRPTRLLTLHDGQTEISALERTPIVDDAGAPLELLPGCEITLTDVGLFDGMLLLEPGCVALHSAAPPQPARRAADLGGGRDRRERSAAEVLKARVAAAARVDGVVGRCAASGGEWAASRPVISTRFNRRRATATRSAATRRGAARSPPPRSARCPRG